MRRFAIALTCFMLMFTLMPFAGALAESGDDVVVVNPTDEFIAEHADDAIICTDSPTFDVQFSILESSRSEELYKYQSSVQFVLLLTSKIDKTIYDLHIDAHYSDIMQPIVVTNEWYNDYFNLYPVSSGKVPIGIEYTKDSIIDLRPISILGGITLDDLYDMYIEVTWREGLFDKHSEIWDMSQTGYQAAVDWYNSMPEDAPERQSKLIDEDYLAAINDKAKALSN